jgi:signal transduction histidine kinase
MAVAREAAERVQRVVRDLAVFTRADHGETSRVNLSVPLETAIRLTATTIRHRATLVKDIRPGASVTGNEAQLTQVFVHLLLNAAQAIPEGASAQNEVRVSLARVPDGRVQVTVSDTGHGMSPEVVAQVFDPFFTTRSVGEGVGLGLSVCHGTVTAMGGEILVESERGKGTTFRVILPCSTRCRGATCWSSTTTRWSCGASRGCSRATTRSRPSPTPARASRACSRASASTPFCAT